MGTTIPQLVLGATEVSKFDQDEWEQIKAILQKNHVTELDTAYGYNGSEKYLGQVSAPKEFTIYTKAPGFVPGSLSRESILNGMAESLKRLGTESVDIYFFHSPDPRTPIEESLAAISQLHRGGRFKRFGLSNFEPADVQKIYDIQKLNNSVLPSVYQGNYNAVARSIESTLIPALRKLDIAFHAYSPIAGGFLAKTSESIKSGMGTGRFAPGHFASALYSSLYVRPSLLTALDIWASIADDVAASKAELAYRWVAYHGALDYTRGDAIVFGASSVLQLEQVMAAVSRGPLPPTAVERIEGLWEMVKDEAPVDNYNSYVKHVS